MKPLRVLCISRACAPDAGGMERLNYELVEELKKLPGVAVTTLIRSSTSRPGAILFALTSIPRALWLARQADVVHLGDPVLALPGWLIKKILGKPVAVTIHGLDVTYPTLLYQLYLKIFGQFDLCLPISQYAQQLLRSSKVKSQNSKVITPGVDDRYFDPTITRDQLTELVLQTTNYKIQTTHKVLLTVGRLVKRKGQAWFIEQVLPHLPSNTVYLIAGDGLERAAIEEVVQRSGSQVLLLGRVSDEDLKIMYNTVDAFIQPNIPVPGDAEGFGLVLLEAALCQRPVFAANLDGIPDAIHNEKNGALLPAGEVQAWINGLRTLPAPSPAARDYTLQYFGWSTQAQKYLAALTELTHEP